MDVFTAIAESGRRKLLESLLAGEAPVKALVALSGMSQPVVSKHLRVLRDAGLVAVRPAGQHRLYRLAPEPLGTLAAWLEPYRQFWAERLDSLERHLETDTFASTGAERGQRTGTGTRTAWRDKE